MYKRGFDLRAQRREVRSTSVISSDLNGEERGSQVRKDSLILSDDKSAQTGRLEIYRGEGANLPLDSGAVDGDAADLVQRSRVDDAAELSRVARVGLELGVEDCG